MRQKFRNLASSLPTLTALLFLLLATALCVNLVRGIRAFARGENLWSKSEKEVQIDLLLFTYSRDRLLLADAAKHMAVLEGDRAARLQLDSGNPNYQIVAEQFVQGGNAREDIPGALRVYRLFGHVQSMSRALAAWRDTDGGVNQLGGFLSELSALDSSGSSGQRAEEIRSQLMKINRELAERQIIFSESMNSASSQAELILLITNVIAGVVLISAAQSVSRRLTRRLRRSRLRDLALRKANDELEARVRQRTADLEREIYERKQAEAELRWKTAFLEAQGNSTIDGILVVDRMGEKIFTNDQLLRLWKLPQHLADDKIDASQVEYASSLTKDPDGFLKRVLYLYDHPDEISRDEIELRDGTVLDRYSAPVLGKDGKLYGRLWVFRDITEQRQSEDALRASEERFRLVVESAPMGMFIQVGGFFRYLNPAALALFGAETADQVVGHAVVERIHPNSRAAVMERMRVSIEERKPVPFLEEQYLRLNGTVFDVEVTAIPFIFEGNEGALVFVSDITARKRKEQALRESEERFRQVVEGAPIAMFIGDKDGSFRYLNPAALAMFGAEREDQLVGQSVMSMIHPEFRAIVAERIPRVRDDKQILPFLEERYLRLDETIFDTEVTAMPFEFEGNNSAVVFFRDISDRKREESTRRALEQQLLQAQKMEAVGRLAGGIAHDFNNLLMVIRSYTELLQNSVATPDTSRRYTEQVLKAADRAASLTRQLLAFSRKQVLSPIVLDLNAVIDDAAKMLRRLIGEDIEFRVNPAESLWAIEADPDQIVQVLMNLCVNARDAMPQGGTLIVATGNVTVEQGDIAKWPYMPPGDYVSLSVSDTGTGISKEEQEQIFDPFFTTKEVGKGTGVGLAMVYGFAKQSSGHVWVDSNPGHGACFTICLPRVEAAVGLQTSVETGPQPRGTETLLVAEDVAALREVMCDYLRGLGYTVFTASSGQHAISLATQQEGHIDLLITDVVMPRMNGRELSQTLGRLCPALKTIYMSGHTDDAMLRHGIHELGATFLQKPFSLGTLARKVRETLGPA